MKIYEEPVIGNVYEVYIAKKTNVVAATIDRTYQDAKRPLIIVTFPNGFDVKFFVNLSDQELIRRANIIRFNQTENER